MGRRSRKRPVPPPAERREPAAPSAARTPPPLPSRRARLDEAPKAPWSPFPLVELCILGGLVLMVVGFIHGGNRGGLFVVCRIALVAVASLELAIRELFAVWGIASVPVASLELASREHFAAYRSHSSLLAGPAALATTLLCAAAL